MASTLPRGIQIVHKPNKIYYRVKINRKDFKVDKYFTDSEEAKQFLALSKATKGKELIYSIESKQERQLDNNNYSLGYFIDLYIDDYINAKPFTTELQRRNKNNKLSFYKTIKNTSILDRYTSNDELESLGIDTLTDRAYRKFGAFDIRTIKAIDVNNYIKSRLNFVKPISISREISYLSNIFRKLQYFNESLADLPNPATKYDRDLLGSYTITKRETILTEEQEQKIYQELVQKDNKDLYKISKLSLLTAMRRSEIVYLKKEQVHPNFIGLTHTKSGKPRKVYLTKEAREFIDSLEVLPNGRYFSYSIGGFEKMWTDFLKKIKLHKIIRFHDLRRTNISKLLTRIGHDNTILATEILGLQSLKKFEELHSSVMAPTEPKTQQEALKHFGHGTGQTTKAYYNIVFNLPKVKG